MSETPATDAFTVALNAEAGIDLPLAAMTIGLVADPALDVAAEMAALEGLTQAVCLEVADSRANSQVESLNQALFVTQGFHGDADDYYDPRNCLLHEVVRRRRGMPIALSILYIAIGRRLGLTVEGVGFPAHFIVRVGDEPAGFRYVDPFNRGQEIAEADLRSFVVRNGMDGERLHVWLAAVTPRQILARVLTNLKRAYANGRDLQRARSIVDLLVALTPWAFDEVRDRGLLAEALEDRAAAIADLSTYLDHAGDAADAKQIAARLLRLRQEA